MTTKELIQNKLDDAKENWEFYRNRTDTGMSSSYWRGVIDALEFALELVAKDEAIKS